MDYYTSICDEAGNHCYFIQIGYVATLSIDEAFLIEHPISSLEKNHFKKCPLIHGVNKDEGTFFILFSETGMPYFNSPTAPFVSKTAFDKELRQGLINGNFYYNDLIEDSIKQEYVDWAIADNPEADYFDPWNYYGGDVGFACPMSLEIRAHAMADEYDSYQYYFTHVPSISTFQSGEFGPGWLGAGHAEELVFVFGLPFNPPDVISYHVYTEDELLLSKNMMKYWSNFAKTGYSNKIL